MIEKSKCFVISLPRATHRIPQVKRIVQASPLPTEVLDAVDGPALSAEEIASVYQRNRYRPFYPFALRRGEIGCFLSHRKAWLRILRDDLDAALILEDDIELEKPQFDGSLRFAMKHAEQGDYIQFQVRDTGPHPVCMDSICKDGYRRQLVQPNVVPLRTTAQLVTRDAAYKLLDATRVFDRPVDTFLQMVWETGVRMRIVEPSFVNEVSEQLGSNTIGHSSHGLSWNRVQRELLRPWYRNRIRTQSLRMTQTAREKRASAVRIEVARNRAA
ncbi:glycosyltransferase family 25 protein [Pirellulaceae bacterium SH501]